MARSNWIAPRPDAACGKVFLASRRSAEEHRVALELWILATHQGHMDYCLIPYRCTRCGGFHLARRRRPSQSSPMNAIPQPGLTQEPWDTPEDTISDRTLDQHMLTN
jgi:hypothetical protein